MEINILCRLFGVFLIPLLPAYLLYKLLPSKSTVVGPFKKFKINLGGAFAGYFLLVLIASSLIKQSVAPIKPSCEVWRITGQIEAKPNEPNTTVDVGYIKDTKISVIPANLKVGSNGKFSMKIIVEPGHIVGQRDFPALMFTLPEYKGQQTILEITDPNVVFNERDKLINLKHPVTLERLPRRESLEEPIWYQ